MDIVNDEYYMALALDMAERAQGQTHINPVVGCVVVKDGVLVGIGTHLERGTPHAEVHALNMAGDKAEGSTAYVTLEPCSHYGTTPPCSERLVKEGVRRVVVACEDPNSQVAGKGIAMLREHGIEVEVGLLKDRALKLNDKFFKYITTGLPYVTLKTASTLDGKVASRTGDSKWISNEAAREQVHTLRHRHQGIMVGVETVIKDDPHLTTRLSVGGLNPTRIVVDSKLRTPLDSNIVKDGLAQTVILTTAQIDVERVENLKKIGVTILICGEGPRVDLPLAMKKLGEMQIGSILLEGGGKLNGAMLEAKLIDRVILYLAPKIVGGMNSPSSFSFEGSEWMKDAVRLESLEVELLDDNVCISGIPVWS
ncbi:bifunctional diaminohydroxyphosphoribosylaminopyrimidine deaminase/5-amino-6-(5-phosphoribosylamino)uracil reductase RibD [Paenibacillus crassostreae]|uniref:Riboflavin biosynthesis protein RibD n=1 Tax=Paenibacillus crassostreae TaxID=1763538 RepID=A0A167DIV4_9BACL|nr:bifunctional diaminohydroxyphosphoribosylaminopyrimidine deaminase/5-amino-6-(5-phosphoribosylamino)uracil reductase RibD [Paenibacillus crassostreae]AOZ91417.1 riboflavin biosynthesis protein RibD [Paenibacillus crassostreae]OAB74424.1 bifunctional diaminohydroxyphosphoribosylaminopyrimidine deaminase/5-amino-6-(5-phosphoribosylamino)uracil reductase [Paenibacillus crassostreae]